MCSLSLSLSHILSQLITGIYSHICTHHYHFLNNLLLFFFFSFSRQTPFVLFTCIPLAITFPTISYQIPTSFIPFHFDEHSLHQESHHTRDNRSPHAPLLLLVQPQSVILFPFFLPCLESLFVLIQIRFVPLSKRKKIEFIFFSVVQAVTCRENK